MALSPNLATCYGSARRSRRHFVILGERHFNYLVAEWLEHYHEERPHQSLGNDPLKQPKQRGRPKTHHGQLDEQIVPLTEVRCKQRLGGLLKSFSRKAA
jgi:putative transposase